MHVLAETALREYPSVESQDLIMPRIKNPSIDIHNANSAFLSTITTYSWVHRTPSCFSAHLYTIFERKGTT